MIQDSISNLASITLQEMEAVKLMNRIDTKFLTNTETLESLLSATTGAYLIQEIEGKRLMAYHTVYFDTDEARMFYDHERGKRQDKR